MTTNVDKSFEGPSDFEGMFKQASKPSTSNSFAGQEKVLDGGRWAAVRNHCIDAANKAENTTPNKVHPNNPRFNG